MILATEGLKRNIRSVYRANVPYGIILTKRRSAYSAQSTSYKIQSIRSGGHDSRKFCKINPIEIKI